jgi:hypothetical protein
VHWAGQFLNVDARIGICTGHDTSLLWSCGH